MRWTPVRFKGKEVFAEADDGGRIAAGPGGRVTIVYALGGKPYTTFADRLEPIPGAQATDGPEPRPDDAPGGGSARRAGASAPPASSSVLGGGPQDLVDPHAVHLWTDGACSGNPGPAGSGVVLLDGPRRLELAAYLGPESTNNVAELTAILLGLEELQRPETRTLVVHTDSQYGIGVLARGWKAKANVELIGAIRRALRGLPRVVWHWVRGHAGVAENERCDALARKAIAARASSRTETKRDA